MAGASKFKQVRSALARKRQTRSSRAKKSVRFNVMLRFTPSEEALYRQCIARCQKDQIKLSQFQHDKRLKSHSCHDVLRRSKQVSANSKKDQQTNVPPPTSPTKQGGVFQTHDFPHSTASKQNKCDEFLLPSCSFSVSAVSKPRRKGILRKPLSFAPKRCKNRMPTPRWVIHPSVLMANKDAPLIASQGHSGSDKDKAGPSHKFDRPGFLKWREEPQRKQPLVVDDLSVSIQDMQISPPSDNIHATSLNDITCDSSPSQFLIKTHGTSCDSSFMCISGTNGDTRSVEMNDGCIKETDTVSHNTNNNSMDKKDQPDRTGKPLDKSDSVVSGITNDTPLASNETGTRRLESETLINHDATSDQHLSANTEQVMQTNDELSHPEYELMPVVTTDMESQIRSAICDFLVQNISSDSSSTETERSVESVIDLVGNSLDLPEGMDEMIDKDFWRSVCHTTSDNSLTSSSGNETSRADDPATMVTSYNRDSPTSNDSPTAEVLGKGLESSQNDSNSDKDVSDSTNWRPQDKNQSSLLTSQCKPTNTDDTLPQPTLPPRNERIAFATSTSYVRLSASEETESTSNTKLSDKSTSVATVRTVEIKPDCFGLTVTLDQINTQTVETTNTAACSPPITDIRDKQGQAYLTCQPSDTSSTLKHSSATVQESNNIIHKMVDSTESLDISKETLIADVHTSFNQPSESISQTLTLHLCPVLGCGMHFSQLSTLEEHLCQMSHSICNPLATCVDGRIPTSPACYICPTCGCNFEDERTCLEHMLERNHSRLLSPVPAKVFACPECLRFFPTVEVARRHMKDLSHHGYAFYFPDDDSETSNLEPNAVPERLMAELLERCSRVAHSVMCQDCGQGLVSPQELSQHLHQQHIVAVKCCTSVRDVFSDFLTDQACAECGQFIYTGLPDTGLAVHNGCALQGPVLTWPARTLREFVLRLGIAPVNVGTEFTLDCDGRRQMMQSSESPSQLGGANERSDSSWNNVRKFVSETIMIGTSDCNGETDNHVSSLDMDNDKGCTLTEKTEANLKLTDSIPHASMATNHTDTVVSRYVTNKSKSHENDSPIASTSHGVPDSGNLQGPSSSISPHEPGTSNQTEFLCLSDSEMSYESSSVCSSSSEYSVETSLGSGSFLVEDEMNDKNNDQEMANYEFETNTLIGNSSLPKPEIKCPKAINETQQQTPGISFQMGYKTSRSVSRKKMVVRSAPNSTTSLVSAKSDSSSEANVPVQRFVFGMNASLDSHFYKPSSIFKAPKFREQGTQVSTEDIEIDDTLPNKDVTSHLTANIIRPSKTILIISDTINKQKCGENKMLKKHRRQKPQNMSNKIRRQTKSIRYAVVDKVNGSIVSAANYSDMNSAKIVYVKKVKPCVLAEAKGSKTIFKRRVPQKLSVLKKKRKIKISPTTYRYKLCSKAGVGNRCPRKDKSFLDLNAANTPKENVLAETIIDEDRWCIAKKQHLPPSPELDESLYMLVDSNVWVPSSQLLDKTHDMRTIKKEPAAHMDLFCHHSGPLHMQNSMIPSNGHYSSNLDIMMLDALHAFGQSNAALSSSEEDARYGIVQSSPKKINTHKDIVASESYRLKATEPRYFIINGKQSMQGAKKSESETLDRRNLKTAEFQNNNMYIPSTSKQAQGSLVGAFKMLQDKPSLQSSANVVSNGYFSDSSFMGGKNCHFPLRSPYVIPKHACVFNTKRPKNDEKRESSSAIDSAACRKSESYTDNDRFVYNNQSHISMERTVHVDNVSTTSCGGNIIVCTKSTSLEKTKIQATCRKHETKSAKGKGSSKSSKANKRQIRNLYKTRSVLKDKGVRSKRQNKTETDRNILTKNTTLKKCSHLTTPRMGGCKTKEAKLRKASLRCNKEVRTDKKDHAQQCRYTSIAHNVLGTSSFSGHGRSTKGKRASDGNAANANIKEKSNGDTKILSRFKEYPNAYHAIDADLQLNVNLFQSMNRPTNEPTTPQIQKINTPTNSIAKSCDIPMTDSVANEKHNESINKRTSNNLNSKMKKKNSAKSNKSARKRSNVAKKSSRYRHKLRSRARSKHKEQTQHSLESRHSDVIDEDNSNKCIQKPCFRNLRSKASGNVVFQSEGTSTSITPYAQINYTKATPNPKNQQNTQLAKTRSQALQKEAKSSDDTTTIKTPIITSQSIISVTAQVAPQLARSLLLSLDGPASSRSSVLSQSFTTHINNADVTVGTSETHNDDDLVSAAKPKAQLNKLRTPKIEHLSSMSSIVFADLENFMFFKHFSGPLPIGTFVWGFVCARPRQPFHREKYFRKFKLYQALKCKRCTHVSTDIGFGKDAVDFAMTLAIAKLDDRLPLNIPFYIVSNDGGFREIENQMRRGSRHVKVVAPRKHKLTVATLM